MIMQASTTSMSVRSIKDVAASYAKLIPDRLWFAQDESERSFLERSFLSLCPSVMDLKEAMATNLRRERHAREMTQEELADRAGLSSRYLGSIERGAVSASVTVLGQLAKALRVNPCELIAQPQPRKSSRSG
jgi:DNA-binding XRE family transcriptional regulator